MKNTKLFAVATLATLMGTAMAQTWDNQEKMQQKSQMVSERLTTWDSMPRMTVDKLIAKYGQPDEVTDSYMLWKDTGPWKYTKVWNKSSMEDETMYRDKPYDYSMDRYGFIEQGIYYRMPKDRIGNVTHFDSRLKYDRTDGILSVTSNDEKMNFLTINLAHEVAQGYKTTDDAKMMQSEVCEKYSGSMMSDDHSDWTTKFNFDEKYREFEPVIKMWPDWDWN